MANKITALLIVALVLLCGCTKQMTVVEGLNQESDNESLPDNSADESDVSPEYGISDQSTVLSNSDTASTNDYSKPNDNQSTPETSTPEVSEPEVSTPEVSEPEVSTPEVSEPEKNPPKQPADSDLVLLTEYIPNLKTDIRYATENNFTGKVIYNNSNAYLRYGTVKKLASVQSRLNELGYSLLIWDAYRPIEAQWKLWEICPDASFVSNPNKGYSSHSRGNTVDITLVRLDGTEVIMPSGFDEFTSLADRDYSDVSADAAKNAKMLEEIMYQNGFTGYSKEWWHFSDTVKYDVINP